MVCKFKEVAFKGCRNAANYDQDLTNKETMLTTGSFSNDEMTATTGTRFSNFTLNVTAILICSVCLSVKKLAHWLNVLWQHSVPKENMQN